MSRGLAQQAPQRLAAALCYSQKWLNKITPKIEQGSSRLYAFEFERALAPSIKPFISSRLSLTLHDSEKQKAKQKL